MTLRTRLAIAGAVLLVVIAAAGFLVVRTVESSQLEQVDQRLTRAFPVALAFGFPHPPGSNVVQIHPQFRQNRAITDVYVAVVTDGHRKEVVSPALREAPRIPTELTQSVGGRPVPQTVSSVSGSQQWRAILISTRGSSSQVLEAMSLEQVDATTSRLRLAVLLAGGLVLLVLLAAAFWVERLGLRPIAKVAEVADAITAGDRRRRVTEVAPRTEAAHLVKAFNIMLDEQHAVEDGLRQFVADASHELRTPVTAIRGLADLWSDGHLREGPALDDAMRRIGQEGARMAGLVEKLLLLARLDSNLPFQPQDVDLSNVVRQVIVDAGATNPKRRIDADLVDPCIVEGDEDGLRRVVANLVTNALVHTPHPSPVSVRTATDELSVVLEVEDGGPGMEPGVAVHAFDRFWRGDASRGRPGSGLGLSIVAAIVATHRGEVTMRTDPATGTCVRVVIPIRQHLEPSGDSAPSPHAEATTPMPSAL